MTLTEQWKNRKLKAGWYYIITTFTDKVLMEWFDGDAFRTVFTNTIKEVLAPVPSYEEWQELSKQRDKHISAVKDLAYIQEENQRLKGLLEECKPYIGYSIKKKEYLGWTPPDSNILTVIDNVIGEK